MKLWDVLATCLLLLSSVATRPLYQNPQPAKNLPDDITGPYPEQFDDVMDFIEATIGRLRRSSESNGGSRGRREQRQRGAANTGGAGRGGHGDRRKGRGRGGSRGGKGGRGEKGRERTSVQSRGCLLKEVHLNVTDLGLGYQTKEELIFRYCSGPCAEAETNYDKILNNLTHNKKLDKDTPSRTCCRPIAFDDDLSFLDDNVVYHTLKKHSARKCGCV
ncbi:glial cell line-derived neurotrophic factor isoform X2 [Centroberyx affinis]|uniref:glial cell line-derived neurotrophic factor isoform X2 n=1 Tax=Centroberyx affinis TaxID=166261 RepID=UPI003A5BF376